MAIRREDEAIASRSLEGIKMCILNTLNIKCFCLIHFVIQTKFSAEIDRKIGDDGQ